ncbi:MAG: hypothetical protein WD266_12895 [Balneolales bacterium]
MILYIAFPVIGSVCSIVMITHFIWLVQGSLENGGPYSDALIYMDMARDFSFFEDDPLSYRIAMPALVGAFSHLFGIYEFDSVALVFGTFNFAFFLFGAGVMLRMGIYEQGINVLELILPAVIIVFMPFFLSAAFYPLPDTGVFLFFSLILLALFYRNLFFLYVIVAIAVWVSEITLLAVLVVPALNYIRQDNWWQAVLPFIVSGLIYFAVLMNFSPDLSRHFLFSPDGWISTIGSNFQQFDRYFFIQLLPAFGLTIPFVAYRIYRSGSQRSVQVTLMLYLGYYILFLLASPEQTPRLMFMIQPLLILFIFNDKTLEALKVKFIPD